jgi:hypothetical protein
VLTFFTTAKAFTGHSGIIQRNALKSWTLATPDAEVILFGDEEGAAETARELGITHVAEVERVPQGPKVLRSFFDAAQKMAKHDVVCYANCDIIFTADIADAVQRVREACNKFLMVGRRWDTDIREPIAFDDPNWSDEVHRKARESAKQLGGGWIDYFVFPRGFYAGKLPEMVIGRVHWDQWLVWKAREMGADVVDASEAVMAIHQNHDYGYHPAGKSGVWSDELSQRNYALAGGRWHLRTIDDATHVLRPDGISAKPGRTMRGISRTVRTAREAAWTAGLDWTRPVRRALGLRKKTSQG